MAAARVIWRRHLSNGGIQGFLVDLDVLHRVMRPAVHGNIPVVIKIPSNFPASFCIINFVVSHNRS
jgi:hypothetical protein